VRGNLPRQLEQDSAVYILFGGSRIENGIYPDDALVLPEEPVRVETDGTIKVYGAPLGMVYWVPSDEVGTASGTLEADGISPDGQWVRIFYMYQREFGERADAWVRVSDLNQSEGIDTLPEIGPDSYTTMQRLFLSNIFIDPLCENVPAPGLLVQGPAAIEFDFWINNLPSRVTSTAYFEQIAPRAMRITALSGFTILWPDTGDEIVIPAGFHRIVCLTPLMDLGIDSLTNDRQLDINCGEGRFGALGGADIGRLQSFESLEGNTLNYTLGDVPEETCPSGIGEPECTLQVESETLGRIQGQCELGNLTQDVCQRYGL
jgi:hypothetical protein